jgi:HlyD family secretion protein
MAQNYLKWIAAVAVVIVSGALVLVANSWQLPVSVLVAKIEKDVPIQIFGLGTIEAQTISKIGFETAGTLVELKADQGDIVKSGALLAKLHSREQETHVAQARAAVAQAEAAIGQAEAAVEKSEAVLKQKGSVNARRRHLVERGVVSQETLEDTQATADIAKADLRQSQNAVRVAQANLEQAKAVLALEETRLAKYSLYAPFNAMVMTRARELGSALNANEQVFTLLDIASVWALAYIDEARAGPIEIGLPAQVTLRSSPDKSIPAKVVRIDIESDRVNEERRVYVRCDGSVHTLHIGEQVEVRITVATLPTARLVRLRSLQNVQNREATAWTVENGRLQQRRVTLGYRTLDGRVEVTGGVSDGVEIVSDVADGLKIGRRASIASVVSK